MLSQDLKDTIQTAYRRLLAARSLSPRLGQRTMIAEIARTLGGIATDEEGVRSEGSHVVVVEAGTGTGKTLAYLLATVPVAREQSKTVVISTATVSLQEQLINRDIPDVQVHSGMHFTAALAKGRGRYLCLAYLDRLMTPPEDNPTLALFETWQLAATDRESAKLYADMHAAVESGTWSGDRDEWPGMVSDEQWQKVAADYHGCTGRHCPFYEDCFFYKARSHLGDARVIVANHDLVLADLALGGGQVLPPPEKTIYVFDEAHHLPDKALNHLACSVGLRSTQQWARERARWLETAAREAASTLVDGWRDDFQGLLPSLTEALEDTWRALEPTAMQGGSQDGDSGRWQHRFGLRDGFPGMEPVWSNLSSLCNHLLRWNEGLGQFVNDCLEGNRSELPSGTAEAWMLVVNSDRSRLENLAQVVHVFSSEASPDQPWARWLDMIEGQNHQDIALCTSPILAGPLLRSMLWDRCHAAVATSATLTALGTFDRFRERAGIPGDAVLAEVPSPFDYPRVATLWIADTEAAPEEGLRHSMLVVDTLVRQTSPFGTLVLFTSRRQMEEVHSLLPADLAVAVLVQGRDSKQALVNRHRMAIDQGERSILFGLASFAEGIDLPGAYCETLVIARLPFAVPDAPVDAALSEFVEAKGGKPFFDITVPDAAIRLKQMVGRLIRTESDQGNIYLLDTRVLRKSYGKRLLKSLPPMAVKTFRC
jgi:ATP-dependent DNA helicase DinG